MQKIKILSVFGTRPEVIKMVPIIKSLENNPDFISSVCVTGQHQEMLTQMLKLFEIKPNYSLELMQPNQTLSSLTAKILLELDPIVKNVQPDWLLVQGDTTTCFTASLVGFYNKIKIGHVEAGLRTGDIYSPYPEEANRKLVSALADLHFSPTEQSKQNLLEENIAADKIIVTGNTVIDTLLNVEKNIQWKEEWNNLFGSQVKQLVGNKPYIVVTGHRRESFGEGFKNICHAIHTLAKTYSDWHFIYPVHLNPNVQKPVKELLSNCVNIHLIAPLDYEPFIYLLKHCQFLLTDSGGIQEEAPSLGKPVLVMRDKTERMEGVMAGTTKLVGTDLNKIISAVSELIEDKAIYQKMANARNPFGNGNAAQKIVDAILEKS